MTTTAPRTQPSARLTRWKAAWSRSPVKVRVGLCLLAALITLAVLGPLLPSPDPLSTNPADALHPPSAGALWGTDQFGRDVFSRVVAAAHLDLLIAGAVVLLAAPVGTMLGLVAGATEGPVSSLILRAADVLLSFPAIILALVIVSIVGNGTWVVVMALAVAYLPYFIRVARSRALSERTKDYIDAAVVAGASRTRIIFWHLSRNCLGPSRAQAMLAFGWAILDTAGLAFLGVGIVRPTPEWGLMIGEATPDVLAGVWWTSVFPGVFVALTVLAASLVGSGARERV
ncbi:ABC transporter permease [Plantactinospora sp. GCM10030261]|uniref:ABC transporter permease n=1 Tax=Plantactinospora sp. GCM10030261 TaxID=3273420 RepID=UPI0036152B44